MNPTDLAQEAIGPAPVHGVSFLELFLQAHIVVQMVMAGLLIASIWSWAIVVEKFFAFRRARIESDRFEHMFWSGQSLEDLYRSLTGRTPTAMASVFVAAMREWKRSFEAGARSPMGLQTRIDKVLRPGPYPWEKVLYTGDAFRADEEGFLYFIGRKDDIIKTRGEKVAPKEVENVLYALAGIAEAVVVGVPDPILGHAIKAVVAAPALEETEAEVVAASEQTAYT